MDFKFEIGSFVRLAISEKQKNTPIRWSIDNSDMHVEIRGQILGRYLEECPGGTQRHYTIRWTNFKGVFGQETARFNEIELVASEAFPAAETKESMPPEQPTREDDKANDGH